MSIIALTGGTGFVGSATIDAALAAGHTVRALTRKPQAHRDGVTWVEGALDNPDSLATLCAGADSALHIAGVVNAPDKAGFVAGNIAGTEAMIAAARRCRHHTVHSRVLARRARTRAVELRLVEAAGGGARHCIRA